MNILFYISAFLTGILASMGLGGGMILILYMTLIAGMEQLTAQGVNLLFFIPIATAARRCASCRSAATALRHRSAPASGRIICGVLSAVAGTYIAKSIGNDYLTKIFAVFVLITGVKELFSKTEKSEK